MASTPQARQLTEAHRLAQARIGAATVAQMLAAWPLLDPSNIDGTVERWLDIVTGLVQAQRRESAALAANYLTTFRALELGVAADTFTPQLDDRAQAEAVRTSMLVVGPARIRKQATEAVPQARSVAVAQAAAAREAMRHVLAGGRGTVLNGVRSDRRALGWARATSGSPCHFCAMLASRGPVYDDDTVHFRSHGGCSCSAEPVYRDGTDWPLGGRRYQQMWEQAKDDAAEQDVKPEIAFRRLIEGRANHNHHA